MALNWNKIIHDFLIPKFLFILITITGAIVALNGLIYSNLNATLNGSILIVLGLTLFFLFNPHLLRAGLIIHPKNPKK